MAETADTAEAATTTAGATTTEATGTATAEDTTAPTTAPEDTGVTVAQTGDRLQAVQDAVVRWQPRRRWFQLPRPQAVDNGRRRLLPRDRGGRAR